LKQLKIISGGQAGVDQTLIQSFLQKGIQRKLMKLSFKFDQALHDATLTRTRALFPS
jgi:hypothetical protein